ncbi:diphosphomevalonate decarboxylase [Candidatus Woesearchaeota archaeon]|nr:diphosphomevalonate decarboxylase [Candidatus Woesearchaeota archaeon]
MKATAIAHPNIALVKYWGKRDREHILPYNSSISVTLDSLETLTTAEFYDGHEDVVMIGQQRDTIRMPRFLDTVRAYTGIEKRAKVVSESNFPAAAGLASSSSGYAAAALAVTKAAGLELTAEELSRIARRGSGSAARSVHGGFVEWEKGVSDEDSYGRRMHAEWPELRITVAVTSTEPKETPSREAMEQTVETSPYYKAWLASIDEDLAAVRRGIALNSIRLVGETAEHNCLKMHALMLSTQPPLIYWNESTMAVMKAVQKARHDGIQAYFTIDAGPNVCILTSGDTDTRYLTERLEAVEGVDKILRCGVGAGARYTEDHLF